MTKQGISIDDSQMRIKDRTAEFFSALSVRSRQSGPTDFNAPLMSPRTAIRQHTQFTLAALQVNSDIRGLLGKLEKLAKLANSRRIYEDRSAEVKELTFIIKKDLTILTGRVEALKDVRQGSGGDGFQSNVSSENHRNEIVNLLRSQLASAGGKFAQVLQNSSNAMRAQRERREQFGAATTTASSFAHPSAASSISRSAKVQQHRSGTASPSSFQHANGSDYTALDMSLALTEPTVDLESRNNALQGIESTINELGAIYQQLAHMIAQQGESIQRIDLNIESMQINVQRGQQQLLKYLRSVSNNRWLMIKMFAVLIVFIVLFMFFRS